MVACLSALSISPDGLSLVVRGVGYLWITPAFDRKEEAGQRAKGAGLLSVSSPETLATSFGISLVKLCYMVTPGCEGDEVEYILSTSCVYHHYQNQGSVKKRRMDFVRYLFITLSVLGE